MDQCVQIKVMDIVMAMEAPITPTADKICILSCDLHVIMLIMLIVKT